MIERPGDGDGAWFLSDGEDARLIGHRGCADQYPENTRLAVRQSAPHVDAIEIDVRRCGSGELVAFHDELLDRLTGRPGAVCDTTWERLRECTVLDSEQPVARLSTLLEAVPADTAVNVELKERGLEADAVEAAGCVDSAVLFLSFDSAVLRELRRVAPDAARALIVATDEVDPIQRATELGCVAVHPQWGIVDRPFVSDAHDAGLAVNAWTVAERAVAADLVRIGVDGLIVDRWDVRGDGRNDPDDGA